MHSCRSCASQALDVLLDFGPQPPSNRFERPGSPPVDRHPLVVGQCLECALIQLIDPMPVEQARSRYEWLTYNEPEGHLDDLVERLRALPGVGADSRIFGLTYKDDTTLARFNKLGYRHTFRYDAAKDLSLDHPCSGLESIQAVLDSRVTEALAVRHGQCDLLLARHILEHAHQPAVFLGALRKLVRPDGYVVFEMPDCTKFVRACDYSFFWEEHITYFSKPTLSAFFAHAGLGVRDIFAYPYPLEDSLTGIVQNANAVSDWKPAPAELAILRREAAALAQRYPELTSAVQDLFGKWRKQGKRIALFGAGHLAAKFANMFGVGPFIECVIDDNPNKQALLMPGSRLPIRGSSQLSAVDICLLSLNPESEQKVLAKNKAFLDKGGEFLSIFALSPKTVQGLALR